QGQDGLAVRGHHCHFRGGDGAGVVDLAAWFPRLRPRRTDLRHAGLHHLERIAIPLESGRPSERRPSQPLMLFGRNLASRGGKGYILPGDRDKPPTEWPLGWQTPPNPWAARLSAAA